MGDLKRQHNKHKSKAPPPPPYEDSSDTEKIPENSKIDPENRFSPEKDIALATLDNVIQEAENEIEPKSDLALEALDNVIQEAEDEMSNSDESQKSSEKITETNANDLEIIDLEVDATISSTSPNATDEAIEDLDDESVTSFPPPRSSKTEVIVVGADSTLVDDNTEISDQEEGKFFIGF